MLFSKISMHLCLGNDFTRALSGVRQSYQTDSLLERVSWSHLAIRLKISYSSLLHLQIKSCFSFKGLTLQVDDLSDNTALAFALDWKLRD